MARIIEDGPEPHDLLLETIAQECRDNRAAIDRLDTRFDRLEGHLNTRMDTLEHRVDAIQTDMSGRFDAQRARADQCFDRVDERTAGIFEMLEKHDKWLMRLLILGEGTGGK